MGHYDSCYELDAKVRRKAEKTELKQLFDQLSTIRVEAKTRVPKRFEESLEDMANWLRVRIAELKE